MTIFDQINSIFFSKKKMELNCDDESQFSSFMINRWLSFYSPEVAVLVNDLTNKQPHTNDKNDLYDFYFSLYPKLKFKRINYIKKTKKETKKEDKEVFIPEFLSKKEYDKYVEFKKELDI
jgi:hypothetical protein